MKIIKNNKKLNDYLYEFNESDMKYQALAMIKDIHTQLAQISFVDVMAIMNPDNPAKKEIQSFETKINDLTTDIGQLVQKYIPDVADADPGDVLDKEENQELENEPEEKPKKLDKSEKPEKINVKEKSKEVKESFRKYLDINKK
jgi:hypothetical protein